MPRSYWPILVMAGGLAQAQTQTGAAIALVQQAGSVAMGAKSWRGEGTLVRAGADGKDLPGVPFKISWILPRYARLEVSGGEMPLTRVCEGTAQWTYYPILKGFVRVLLPQIGPCAFPLNAWAALSGTLQNPVFVATDTITVDGQAQPCQVVRGDFTWTGRDAGVKEIVTLCIDRAHKRILRYQLRHISPGPESTETYTFSSLQLDPELDRGLFDFQAPEGSRAFATIDWLTPIPGTPEGVKQVSNAVAAPILTSMTPPLFPAEAAMVEGGNTVAVRVEIGKNGVPRQLQVSRSLGLGLDEAAIKCISHWKFEPAMSAAGPVVVAATIFVHFMEPRSK